jgi:hypothetical protein
MGGMLTLVNRPGKGLAVSATLPCQKREAHPHSEAAR